MLIEHRDNMHVEVIKTLVIENDDGTFDLHRLLNIGNYKIRSLSAEEVFRFVKISNSSFKSLASIAKDDE